MFFFISADIYAIARFFFSTDVSYSIPIMFCRLCHWSRKERNPNIMINNQCVWPLSPPKGEMKH